MDVDRPRGAVVSGGAWRVGHGEPGLELLRDRADPVGGDDVVREGRAARAVGVAGGRIVDGGAEGAEVTGPHGRGRECPYMSAGAGLVVALPGPEEEELVLDDGAAQGDRVDVPVAVGLRPRVEEVARLEPLVCVPGVAGAVELVGAGLGQHRDGSAPRHALLGIEAVGRDVDRVHRLRRRDVLRVVREEDVDVGRAVELGVVHVSGSAVDVGGQRAARRVGDGVLGPGGCRAGYEVQEALVVA